MPIQHFLLTYNLRKQVLEHIEEFGTDARAATEAYAEIEQEFRDRPDHADFEIVLFGADSLETIRMTHSRYFNGGLRLPSVAYTEIVQK